MLSRPTTEQILLDCCTQLRDKIAPALHGGEGAIAAKMLEDVLRNCAMRAAHEIAWMREETDELLAFARDVVASPHATSATTDALARADHTATDSLHLDDVVAAYGVAGACFEAALDAVIAAGDLDLRERARTLLDARLVHENEIKGEWGMVGRG